ncbi:hypothetical protein MBLNU230_g8055t1 [Neophaeotheca triangularis]
MAPNGTSRKTPAPVAGTKRGSDEISGVFDDLRDGPIALKEDVLKSLPKVKNPGNWDSEVTGNKVPKTARTTSLVNKIPSNIAKAFPTNRPMSDKPEILKCNHCKRAVSKHVMPKHIEGCLNKKQEKQRKKKEAKDARDAAARKEKGVAGDSDEEEEGETSKTASKTSSKKRRAEDVEGDGPVKKKKKKDDKTKVSRPKAPVDVEKQCGVELPQGGQCARSLTCKSHSMGAKRAVPGRSAPYDKLLMEYQRKNQAERQKAAFDANAPNPDDDNVDTGPVDSEEEKDAVMAAIKKNWGGAPLWKAPKVPMKLKTERVRFKSMLAGALNGRHGNLFGLAANGNTGTSGGGGGGGGAGGGTTTASAGGGFFGSQTVQTPGSAPTGPTVDNEGVVHARRGSVVPGARSMMAPAPSRKASAASGAA